LADALAIAYIDRQVPVVWQRRLQFLHDCVSRALLTEELAAHIVVDPHNLPAFG
jgi:hypothetical protein